MVRYFVLCLSVALGLVGCRSAQLGNDQADMRQTLLRLYEQQVLDNLIRAREKLPIVQIDYSNMTGTLDQNAAAELSGTMTRQSNTPTALFATLLRFVIYVVGLKASASERAQLTLTGQPVILVDSVYDEYLDALAKDPNLVEKAKEPLPDGSYHLKREFRGDTWYVANTDAKKAAFFKLYLATTVQRQTKVPYKVAVSTAIVEVGQVKRESPIQSLIELKLQDKIPNDSGTLTVFLEGVGETRYRYIARKGVPDGAPTDRVTLNIDESERPKIKGEDLAKLLVDKPVLLRNDTFLPGVAPAPPVPNEPIRSQLELLRLQQQFNR